MNLEPARMLRYPLYIIAFRCVWLLLEGAAALLNMYVPAISLWMLSVPDHVLVLISLAISLFLVDYIIEKWGWPRTTTSYLFPVILWIIALAPFRFNMTYERSLDVPPSVSSEYAKFHQQHDLALYLVVDGRRHTPPVITREHIRDSRIEPIPGTPGRKLMLILSKEGHDIIEKTTSQNVGNRLALVVDGVNVSEGTIHFAIQTGVLYFPLDGGGTSTQLESWGEGGVMWPGSSRQKPE